MKQTLASLQQKEIKLGFYPYTYVRVVAMKGKLFKRNDYEKILKLGIAELAKFLEESDYKKEINDVTQQYPEMGFDLLELALNRHRVRTIQKLKAISADTLQRLIDAYTLRYDYYNIKTIIRGKHAQLSAGEIGSLLIPLGRDNVTELGHLMQQETVEKIIAASTLLKKHSSKLQAALQHWKEQQSLTMLEQAIDHLYYEYLATFSQRIPKQGKLFRDFLQYEIDILNIKTLLRLKQQKIPEQKIKEHLLIIGRLFSGAKLASFLGKDLAAIKKELEQTILRKDTSNKNESPAKDDLVALELMLDRYLLKKATLLLHQYPLSVDTLLSYLFAKEIEIRNLRTIIKGKQLNVDKRFIEQQLIIA